MVVCLAWKQPRTGSKQLQQVRAGGERVPCGAQLPEAPAKAQVFLEDLPEEEQDVNGFAKYGAGARRCPAACCVACSQN